jgi:hypothetical protein
MVMIAKALELRTAQAYPQIVGGHREVAVLSAGTITQFVPNIEESLDRYVPQFQKIVGGTWDSGGLKHAIGISVPGGPATPTKPWLVSRVTLVGETQPLDNIIFSENNFTDCVLRYDGAPMVYFDRSNTVKSTVLKLGPNVTPDNAFVKQLKLRFSDSELRVVPLDYPAN